MGTTHTLSHCLGYGNKRPVPAPDLHRRGALLLCRRCHCSHVEQLEAVAATFTVAKRLLNLSRKLQLNESGQFLSQPIVKFVGEQTH